MLTIKSVFEDVAKDIVIDAKLIQRIHEFERAFVNRNEDHVAFFGGNLMGVHPMRFRPIDRDNWFNDVIEMDDLRLEDGIQQVKSIAANWRRANDVMNLSCIWLIYAIENSKLPPDLKAQGQRDVLLILQYKFLGSLMAHYYPYPADIAVMQATYAELSRKYALKVAGSWTALLNQRAVDIVNPRSIHRRAINTFADDKAVIYMVSDIQGRLKEIVKSMTAVFYRVKSEGARIGTEKSVVDIDGEAIVREKTKKFSSHIRYLHDVIGDKNSFIRQDLVGVIGSAMHTMPPRALIEALEWMSINHRQRGAEEVEVLIDECLLHAFELITANKDLLNLRGGVMPLLAKLRSLYMASRMSDPVLLKTKDLADTIVAKSVKSKNASVLASVRTGIQLYIVLRAMAMNYYQS